MGRTELVQHLRELAEELGRSPTTEDMHEHGRYSAQAYYHYFDTWDETLEAAGLDGTATTRANVIEDLQRIQNIVGNPSSWAEAIREHGQYPLSQVYSKFGDLESALDAAGIERQEPDTISQADVIEEITRLATDGTSPTADQMDEEGTYSARTCHDLFGSWSDALRAAGYKPPRTGNEYTETELLDEVERLAEEFGRAPTTREMREQGKYTASVYFRRFDSWNDAIRAAGYTPAASSPDASEQRIPASELLEEIDRLADQVGGRPTAEQMNEHGQYSVRPYVNRFGSWNNAIERAGFSPFTGTSEDLFSREELITELRRLGNVVDRPPTVRQMTELGRYSLSPYKRRFGSWVEALRAAGFEPTTHQLRRYDPDRDKTTEDATQ